MIIKCESGSLDTPLWVICIKLSDDSAGFVCMPQQGFAPVFTEELFAERFIGRLNNPEAYLQRIETAEEFATFLYAVTKPGDIWHFRFDPEPDSVSIIKRVVLLTDLLAAPQMEEV